MSYLAIAQALRDLADHLEHIDNPPEHVIVLTHDGWIPKAYLVDQAGAHDTRDVLEFGDGFQEFQGMAHYLWFIAQGAYHTRESSLEVATDFALDKMAEIMIGPTLAGLRTPEEDAALFGCELPELRPWWWER